MVVYQAHYYGPSADDILYYGGSEGKLFLHKEDCEDEATSMLNDDDDEWTDVPTGYTIMELTIH